MKRRRMVYVSMSVLGVTLVFYILFSSHYSESSHCSTSDCHSNGANQVVQTSTAYPSLIVTSTITSNEELLRKGDTPADLTQTDHPTEAQLLLNNVYISIKTTQKYHHTRLPILLLTWLQTVPSRNVHIVTDGSDNITDIMTANGYTVHYSACPTKHTNSALACKCGDEFDLYYKEMATSKEKYQWYCHLDDDMYLNTPQLETLLSSYDPSNAHYLGRWSVGRNTRIKPYVRDESLRKILKRDSYYFATGAIYCISSSLMSQLEEYIRGSKLVETAKAIGVPDDMVVGFVIESVFGYNLTIVKEMVSHLNPLHYISLEDLPHQITISYSGIHKGAGGDKIKRINLPKGVFNEQEDPTRFFSYHCILYPIIPWCLPTNERLPKLWNVTDKH